ncbi:GntR family transcriptional regulator [Roseibium sp. SCP14]|uniref:GntR family transcriptional regulator n=1 Tax=Roseibium sp. SCP14 TaxID=3141375 RepID=UPI003338648D
MSKEIYSVIKQRILSGEYASGEIIKEKNLAEELDVSRTPIRENLARLEWEKLVTIIPRAGAMVAPIELNLVKEAYQVRFVLDGYLGRLAIARITREQIQELEALKAQCEGYVNEGTQEDLNNISNKVRAVLGKAANNKTLFELSEMLFNITLRVWYSITEDDEHSELANALISEIDALIKACKDKDANAAEKAMQDAVVYYTEKLKKTF